ncbi:ABC transporter substrate-binding protein [Roseomonas eburnea]|uniref:ABC transporter substrate-binding protein n=1 Tax=Neoroseomonas eburnea TaxID=1346889 RepID=A0A9X9XGG6_9PROT|nr:ABC transporter substrate-binding protein [Neoroseomonas eburnea]MBR0682802.1 ABC transporter substrate-binding protein [Neoroseomonas eburnea]
MNFRRMARALALAPIALCAALGGATAQERTLRVSLNTELQVLDPIVTTINATRVFSYLVYDMLFAIDGEGNYQPQMVETYTVSDDRLTYSFRLREGLEWSDGTPVTSEDAVASIRRWAQREALGVQIMRIAEGLRVVDARTFELKLREPYAFVIEALGKPGNVIPVMMPARLANLPANTAVPEVVGSGPFLFDRAGWRPGERATFRRNPRYRPRTEPASGLAGGKVVHFDRVDLISLPDQATRVAALQANEVDYLEIIAADYIEPMRRNRNITIAQPRGAGQIMAIVSLNHAQPPFDNPAIRRAAQLALNQEEVMASIGLPAGMYLSECRSLFMCDTATQSNAGADVFRNAGIERARTLLREAGYNNEPLVFLHSESSALLNPMGVVIADQMRRAGFNVQLATSDYATVAQRRLKRDPVSAGGWSMVNIIWNGIDLVNPLANPGVAYNCATHYSGWYCDPRQTELLRRLASARTAEERTRLADELQAAFHDNVNYILGGQFSAPAAYRSELQNVIEFPIPIFWNMSRR